ncbi:hypothetical protein P7C70_g2858, partial [Phenoliferia sp. Uapishka_3]
MAANLEEVEETLNAEQLTKAQVFCSIWYPAFHSWRASSSLRLALNLPAPERTVFVQEVWLYLLEVLSPDRTNEITSVRSKYQSYTSMDKSPSLSTRLRGETQRYYNRRLLPYTRQRRSPAQGVTYLPPNQPQPQQEEPMDIVAFTTSVENVLSAFLNRNRNIEYKTGLVQLVAPFVWTLKTEAGMYFCFERLMTKIGSSPSLPIRSTQLTPFTKPDESTEGTTLSSRISFFLSLFRSILPDLWSYFDEEDVDVRELASAWLQWYFAKEMPVDILMRLWDVYFSVEDLVDLHQYVCLAILTTCKETLEELDESEVRSFLLNLPPLDVDRLIVEANNIKHSFQQQQKRGDRPAEF